MQLVRIEAVPQAGGNRRSKVFKTHRDISPGEVWIDHRRRRWHVLAIVGSELRGLNVITRFVAVPAVGVA